MKRQKINEGDQVEVRMSARERELLVDHTFADPGVRCSPTGNARQAGYTVSYRRNWMGSSTDSVAAIE